MSWNNAYLSGPSGKCCAFCKFWYDPANSAIRPKQPRVGLWEYDHDKSSVCAQCKRERQSWQRCGKFECKV